MRKFFDHIQSQPRSSRDLYAFWGAVICTGCVALLWFWQVDLAPAEPTEPAPVAAVSAPVERESTWPLAGFASRVRAGINNAFSGDE